MRFLRANALQHGELRAGFCSTNSRKATPPGRDIGNLLIYTVLVMAATVKHRRRRVKMLRCRQWWAAFGAVFKRVNSNTPTGPFHKWFWRFFRRIGKLAGCLGAYVPESYRFRSRPKYCGRWQSRFQKELAGPTTTVNRAAGFQRGGDVFGGVRSGRARTGTCLPGGCSRRKGGLAMPPPTIIWSSDFFQGV